MADSMALDVGAWVREHPGSIGGLLALAGLATSSRIRRAALHTLGVVYTAIWPLDQSPIAAHTTKTRRPILLGRSSRFARAPRELRALAKERGISYEELLVSAIDDCTVTPSKGDIVKCWDFLTVWGEDNLERDELERWRQLSDDPADAALAALEETGPLKGSEDAITRIRSESRSSAPVDEFWKHITARPPPGAGALSEAWYKERQGRSISPEEELTAEKEVLRRGQAVFYKYYAGMLAALLHFSLAGGFASPRIVRVLEQTGYLVDGKKGDKMSQARADQSFIRLLETTQWTLDVMEEGPETLIPPSEINPDGGKGWQSTIRVRMLHTKVRRRILKQVARLAGAYDVQRDGIPINQEDLLATLGSFSVATLLSLPRIGLHPSEQEREDYIALWRHIGYYMGVDPELSRRHFRSSCTADQFEFSVIRHLFSEMETTIKAGQEPLPSATMPLLHAVSRRKPFYTPIEAHTGIARHLMGPRLAAALRVPKTVPGDQVIHEFTFFTIWYPVWFGSWYRKGWEVKRVTLARPFLRRIIIWSMGEKQAKHFGGEEEDNEPVTLDEQVGKQLVAEWKAIMREMLLVTLAAAVTSVAVPVFALRAATKWTQ